MRSSQHETSEGSVVSSDQSSTMEIDQSELPTTTANMEQPSQLTSFSSTSSNYQPSLSLWQQDKNASAPLTRNKRKRTVSEDSSEKNAENTPSTPNKRRLTSSANSSKKPLKSENFFYKKTEERVQRGLQVISEGRGRSSKHYVMLNGIKTQILSKRAMDGRQYRYLNEELISDSDKAKIKKGEKKGAGTRRYYIEKSKDELIEVMKTYAIDKRKRKNKKFKFSDDDGQIPLTASIVKFNNKFYAEMQDGSEKEVIERKQKKPKQNQKKRQRQIFFYEDTKEPVDNSKVTRDKKRTNGIYRYYAMRDGIKTLVISKKIIEDQAFYYLNKEKVPLHLIDKIHKGMRKGNRKNCETPYFYIETSENKRIEVVRHGTYSQRVRENKKFKFPNNTAITIAAKIIKEDKKYYAQMEDGTKQEVLKRVFPADQDLLASEPPNPVTAPITTHDSSDQNETTSNTSEVALTPNVLSMFLFGNTSPAQASNHSFNEEINGEFDAIISILNGPNSS